MRNPYLNFKTVSILINFERTHGRTHGQAQNIMPLQLFQSWGHKAFFCVGNHGHTKSEGTEEMRKKLFSVGNYGHTKGEGTIAMRKKLFCVGIQGHTKGEGTVGMRKSCSV